MIYPKQIFEQKDVVIYLKKRSLIKQYIGACKKLTSNYGGKLDFKERNPQGSGIWSFRINKQFRAIGYRREENFIVVEIDNHQ